ncbi:DUF3786 domain-containing protein [Natroniella sulfidigena]|uniref:DUF3786 domain-containing protein n=1 Tax=Natroniella sulfidigena TaxID=723921 RepID=UPI00200BA0DA|nr:DUF3786 domain-containing protein [Natroniella sulfidigena]MCK8818004.1 DUF3786 domain-containing protein [Natroniella sulfidigena]
MAQEKRFKTEIKQNNYIAALKQAKEKLTTLEPEGIVERSGADYNEAKQEFKLVMAGEDYLISYPEGEVTFAAKDQEVQLPIKVLILHYLNQASGASLEGRLISYREVPNGGDFYYSTFKKRATNPLVRLFGENADKLVPAAKYLGGKSADLGDASVTIPVFPKIPVTYVIWEGDDELPPSGSVLFDASVISYLPTEDLAFVASVPVWAFKGIIKNL